MSSRVVRSEVHSGRKQIRRGKGRIEKQYLDEYRDSASNELTVCNTETERNKVEKLVKDKSLGNRECEK